jgi:ABC-2 type transport system permease protein
MRNVWTICRRELYSYFVSPIAWVLLTIFAFLSGYFTYAATAFFIREGIEMQMQGQSMPMSINDRIIVPVLQNVAVIALFLIPLIAMRLFAEEKKQGTIELLVTSPIRDLEMIIGKWLSAVMLYGALLVVVFADLSFVFIYGTPDWKPVALGFLGLLLQGASILSLCTFISTLTKNQIVAAAIGFALSLFLYVISWATAFDSSTVATVLSYLSIVSHYDSFSRGVLDSKDFIFYISMMFFGLFLTARSLESMRWRA